ncbi:MAG: N-acetylglucosamine-6-phosphate deacetylase [Tenericutes bacterium]|nr:N-acetylglucosamine-6-phosphate deacetylase [Mycoplasmatota bacterium]
MHYLIKNVDIVCSTEIIKNGYIEIKNDLIYKIYPNNSNNKVTEKYDFIIDGAGDYIVPGFIDIHTHGALGYDAMDATSEALEMISKYHYLNGVTGYLATTMTSSSELINKALRNAKEFMRGQNKDEGKAEILGVYLEGPYFCTEKKGAQPESDLRNPSIEEMNGFLETAGNIVKVVSLAPELPKSSEFISFLKSKGINIALGHTNAKYDEAKQAIDIGATIATHMFNGMRSFNHREPGVIGAVLTDDRIYTELICDMIHLHKASIDLTVKSKSFDKVILISDSIRATGVPDGEYELAGQKIISKAGVVLLEDNTLAGSTLNIHKAVKNILSTFDYPINEVVNMASLNPAKAIGMDDKFGSVSVGKIANLLFLNKTFDITSSIFYGKLDSNKMRI